MTARDDYRPPQTVYSAEFSWVLFEMRRYGNRLPRGIWGRIGLVSFSNY
jgi:hypothetical protein